MFRCVSSWHPDGFDGTSERELRDWWVTAPNQVLTHGENDPAKMRRWESCHCFTMVDPHPIHEFIRIPRPNRYVDVGPELLPGDGREQPPKDLLDALEGCDAIHLVQARSGSIGLGGSLSLCLGFGHNTSVYLVIWVKPIYYTFSPRFLLVSWIPRFCWWRFSPWPVRCDDEADEDEEEEDEEDEEDEDEENWDVAESNVPILQQVPWPKQVPGWFLGNRISCPVARVLSQTYCSNCSMLDWERYNYTTLIFRDWTAEYSQFMFFLQQS